jgi:hypothetical protein
MVHVKKTHWFNPIPFEILYKPEVVVNLSVSWWIKYICIYNGLNGSSFYQVGACLQAESCYEDWIPHISVGSEINKLGLVMRVGFLISQLDLRTTSWVLYQRVGSLIFS